MQLAQIIKILRVEGYQPSRGRIRGALKHGHIRPLPMKVARGAYDFTPYHLKQLRRYFIFVRPGPRPKRLQEFPICGQSDRIHRLKQKLEMKLKQKAAETQKAAFWADIDKLEHLASQ